MRQRKTPPRNGTQREGRKNPRAGGTGGRGGICCVLALTLLWVSLPLSCRPFQYGETPVLRLQGVHDRGTTSLAFSPSGEHLASGGYWGEIKVWSVPSGRAQGLLKRHRKPVRGLCWVSGTRLMSGAEDGHLVLWDMRDPRPVHCVETPSPITCLVVLRDPAVAITGHEDGWIRGYSLPNMGPRGEFLMGTPLLSLAVDREGRLAASAEGGRMTLLSASLTPMRDLEPSPRDAFEVRFSPDGRQLAGGAWYKLLFWDRGTGRLTVQDAEHWGKVVSVDYSPDGKRLASIGRVTDNHIHILNLATDRVERRLEAHELCGAAVRFSPDGRYLATGSDDASVRLYDLSRAPQ